MKIDTMIEILEKIKTTTSATKVVVYVNDEISEPRKNITSISATSDGYVIINTINHSKDE